MKIMDLFDKIAKTSVEKFNKLPKTGKPTETQWTILSTIIQENLTTNSIEVVALGTGTKCIGINKMSLKGDILNDSHAEIVCRRSFLLYLYTQFASCLNNDCTIFKLNQSKNKFELLEHITFHFFTTHIPCGDATIFPKSVEENIGESLKFEDSEIPNKRRKLYERDIHRTGAKCLKDSNVQDLHLEGEMYHTVSLIRTKPGRGDPTLSVSCSDKIAKWTYMGIQGALLSILLEKPIYLKSLTVAAGIPYNYEALNRAFNTRFADNIIVSNFYQKNNLILNQANHEFQYQRTKEKQPCPSSISWHKNHRNDTKTEVAIEGIKQGATKKNMGTKQTRLAISKIELYRRFLNISEKMKLSIKDPKLSYLEIKLQAEDYQCVWDNVKSDIFKIWTVKDVNLLKFCID